jgi:hypothetical protein
VYADIRKYGSPGQNVDACRTVMAAGITVNATVILGLGGKARSRSHAVNTARVLSQARPDQIAALTLMIADGTPLAARLRRGEFVELKPFDYLDELTTMLENLEDFRCIFMADHPSNYVPVRARFPHDRDQLVRELGSILAAGDPGTLVPEWRRGL